MNLSSYHYIITITNIASDVKETPNLNIYSKLSFIVQQPQNRNIIKYIFLQNIIL